MQLKDYKTVKCPTCGAEAYDFHAANGKYIGNPVFTCPTCGAMSFRQGVLEPSLLTPGECFGYRYSGAYFKLRIALIFVYAAFLGVILWRMDLYLSIYFVVMAILMYVSYEIIRAAHKSTYLKSNEYNDLIEKSLNRMSDFDYAKLILSVQKPKDGCPYLQEKAIQG